jgi:AcrR family transcriptional regulator
MKTAKILDQTDERGPLLPTKTAPARKPRRQPGEIRERILEAAGEEFKNFGFSGATTLNIARRADVTEAQLFRYFTSKQVLFHEAVFEPLVRHFDAFDARHHASTADALNLRENARIYINELQDFIREHSKMLMSLVFAQTYTPLATPGVGEIDSLQSYFARGAAMMTRRTQDRAKVEPKLMVRVSFAAVLAAILFKDWLFPQGLATEAEISDALIDFVIDGIALTLDPKPES